MCLNGSLFFHNYGSWRACQVARVVKNPPVNAGDAGRRHGFTPRLGSYPRERMATHCRILAWKISETEQPGGLESMELQRVRHDLVTKQQSSWHIRSILKCWENWNFGVYISNWPNFMKEIEKSKSGTPKSKFVSCLSWSEPVFPTPPGVFHSMEYEWGGTGP